MKQTAIESDYDDWAIVFHSAEMAWNNIQEHYKGARVLRMKVFVKPELDVLVETSVLHDGEWINLSITFG